MLVFKAARLTCLSLGGTTLDSITVAYQGTQKSDSERGTISLATLLFHGQLLSVVSGLPLKFCMTYLSPYWFSLRQTPWLRDTALCWNRSLPENQNGKAFQAEERGWTGAHQAGVASSSPRCIAVAWAPGTPPHTDKVFNKHSRTPSPKGEALTQVLSYSFEIFIVQLLFQIHLFSSASVMLYLHFSFFFIVCDLHYQQHLLSPHSWPETPMSLHFPTSPPSPSINHPP